MGFRFRKSIGLGKFARLNLGKKSGSISIGVPGFRMNFGSRGTKVTTGIPGTGLSYTSSLSSPSRSMQLSGAAPQTRKGLTGCGCLLSFVALGIVIRLFEKSPAAAIGLVVLVVAFKVTQVVARKRREVSAIAAAEYERQQRWTSLCERFGEADAQRIWEGSLWVGATPDMVFEMLGSPVDTDETVMRTKTKRTLKYSPTGANRYGLRVFVEDGLVIGWEDKR